MVVPRGLQRDCSWTLTDPMRLVRGERQAAASQLQHSLKRWRKESGGAAGRAAAMPQGGGAPLDRDVRRQMEGGIGADSSAVRVHTGGEAAAQARALGARAFTVGNDVHFGDGEFQPGNKEGDRLIAHELTHAVQGQRSGVQRKPAGEDSDAGGTEHDGVEVSQPHEPAEQEADAVADCVADGLHDKDKANGKGKGKGKESEKDKKDKGEHAAHGKDDHDSGDKGHGNSAQDAPGAAPADGPQASAAAAASPTAAPAPPIAAKLVGVGRKIFRQRAGTPQTGEVAQNNPQAKDSSVAPPSLDNPVLHPYFPTFKARVAALASTGHVSIGDPASYAQTIWVRICNEVKAAAPAVAGTRPPTRTSPRAGST